MKYPLAGVCSRDIQCETGHLRYSLAAILFPEPTGSYSIAVLISVIKEKWANNHEYYYI